MQAEGPACLVPILPCDFTAYCQVTILPYLVPKLSVLPNRPGAYTAWSL
jgi:hypothetical protein